MRTLMMIHGLIGTLHYFNPDSRIGNALVWTLDLLGYGWFRDAEKGSLSLTAQADHLATYLEGYGPEQVWLLGHSMGGAIAVILADRRPGLVRGIVNVEGNFTPKDAFWSRKIVAKGPAEWADEYHAMQNGILDWLERNGIQPTPQRIEWATQILDNQPPSTVHAMAEALVNETDRPQYLEAVRRVLERGVPMHLIAGARSAAAWDIPDFVRAAAPSYTEIPEAGHLMMLEDPAEFCRVVGGIMAQVPAPARR